MFEINEILKRNDLHPRKYTKKNSVVFVDTDSGKYTVKKVIRDNDYIYDYLKSRSFNYFPMVVDRFDSYQITPYIESFNIPREQKILDMIDMVGLLHNKTTHYKEITEDDYKEIYEDLNNNIDFFYGYYMDIISIIETKVYMSPYEYTLARNISKVFSSLDFIKNELDLWYELARKKKKKRLVVLHNNLDIDHFINSDVNYLVSWDKSKIDLPVFDIYKLYLRHGLEFDFEEIFRRYEKCYPLYDDERQLFFILISFPWRLDFNDSQYVVTREVGRMIDYLYKTERFILPYYSNKGPENNSDKKK